MLAHSVVNGLLCVEVQDANEAGSGLMYCRMMEVRPGRPSDEVVQQESEVAADSIVETDVPLGRALVVARWGLIHPISERNVFGDSAGVVRKSHGREGAGRVPFSRLTGSRWRCYQC